MDLSLCHTAVVARSVPIPPPPTCQTKFEADDLEYLYEVIPQIVRDAMRIGDIEV